jgi:processive 1,2-diacylglycerol beta-glucosyltransferase
MTKSIIVVGASLGFGHINAARNLIEAIQQTHPSWQVQVLDLFDFLPKAFSALTHKGWEYLSTNSSGLYGGLYEDSVSHPLAHFGVGMMAHSVTKRIIQSLGQPPDVFVATHSLAVPVGSLLKELVDCRLCVVTTDFVLHKMHVYPNVDFICVPPLYECKADLNELSATGVIIDTGIPIALDFVTKKDPSELRSKLGLSQDLATVLFSFGGSGLRADRHVELFSNLLKTDLPIQFIVLAGQNSTFAEVVRRRYGSGKLKDRIQVHEFVDNVSDFYAVADVFVGKAGGLSVSEALAVGLPIVIIDMLPGQEECNLKVLKTAAAASHVLNVRQLREQMELLLNKVCQTGKTLHELARPLSSQSVANRITSLVT